MNNFRTPDLRERQQAGAAARKALFEKFQAAAHDPRAAERQAARQAVLQARLLRQAERQASQERQRVLAAEQAERDAQIALERQLEAANLQKALDADAAEQRARLLADQKAARDARYAARKAAKKQRRKGEAR